jgi:asparagine synthase (glutamine-hydrolysing)
MVSSLRHRGPDEAGIYRDPRAGLAHARLSIIDLAGGKQPLSNEDGTLWITFNGEIYNYLELREELMQRGHQFRTTSDTEVIIHGWEEWGDGALSRFNGQWAFALWDSRRGRLTLTRDRVGIRPLYYAEHGGRIVFASEVKAIFAAEPTFPRRFDPSAFLQTFSLWSVIPPRSVFQGIAELPPGCVRHYEDGRVEERRYWDWTFPEEGRGGFPGTESDAVEAVHEALLEASALRMFRADVPVAAYLSGGLDSSLVTSLAVEAKGSACKTFSLRFEDQEYDETAFQRLMVRELDTDHHEIAVSRGDIARVFPRVVQHTERPILRSAPAPLFLLSELVRDNGIKVVLTGEGADEVFGGYDLFREGVVRRLWAQDPDSDDAPELLNRLYPYLARSPVSQQAMARHFFGQDLEGWKEPGFAHRLRWQTTAALQRLLSHDFLKEAGEFDPVSDLLSGLPAGFRRWGYLGQDQYLEAKTLLVGYILASQGDRMLMGHSVEGRFPFLDVNVIELANGLPEDLKIRDLEEKYILKLLGRSRLPEAILQRPKQPYRAPDALAFAAPDREPWVDEVLCETAIETVGVFDSARVARLWQKCLSRSGSGQFSNTDNMALVGILSSQLLARDVMDGDFHSPGAVSFTIDEDRVTP